MAGLQVGRALGCFSCLGLRSAVPAPHVPGHPTFICDDGVNRTLGTMQVSVVDNDNDTHHNKKLAVLSIVTNRFFRLIFYLCKTLFSVR